MDIEQLTKSQIVLLVLLVSFMTSVATGIVTVALMQQAPPTVVQSVSRIIRQTVGQVASSTRASQPAAASVTQIKTVVVRDSDTISQAVANASRSMVRLYSHDVDNPQFLGLGIIINSSGLVITDISALGENSDATIKRADGSFVRAFVTKRDINTGLAYLTEATSTTVTSLGDPVILSATPVRLGDMVVALGGVSVDQIRAGFATTLLSQKDSGSVAVLETDIPRSVLLPGTPLIDATGNLIGINTVASRAVSDGSFIPVSAFINPLSQGTIKSTTNLAN